MNTRDLDYFRALVDCQNYTMVAAVHGLDNRQ